MNQNHTRKTRDDTAVSLAADRVDEESICSYFDRLGRRPRRRDAAHHPSKSLVKGIN